MRILATLLGIFSLNYLLAQSGQWQQRVEYSMEIDFDVQKHQFSGSQKLKYHNNSEDTLDRVFYHLYFNAFQPGSMMDVRSRTISDPDRRVQDRIWKLKDDEIGYHRIRSLKQEGRKVLFEVVGTILEVELARPIAPGKMTTLEMEFDSQVPVQIRRSGRNNKEGIAYSMTQWYPKLAEYDEEGWHADPYVSREFHGVWGEFEVEISIDSSYVVGGTGYLQNPQEIGHGYADPSEPLKRPKKEKLNWHFKADRVHDFAWAADPDYRHDIMETEKGPTIHFFYQKDTLTENWDSLQTYVASTFEIMNNTFGKYPYEKYSIIQGGDGGMEYPMATLITGYRSFKSLVYVSIHEIIHSWYQMVLATNESKYPWMDEGFTNYAEGVVANQIFDLNKLNPHEGDYDNYFALVERNWQEPLTTPSDHYSRNVTYGVSAYSKGAVFLHQLSYIVGRETFFDGMRKYYSQWKFKHPDPIDFKRVMEKVSGLELDWYFEYWIATTKTIDYGIKAVWPGQGQTKVLLEKNGDMPMPIDLVVTLQDSSQVKYYIPLRIMRGEKKLDNREMKTRVMKDWPWTFPQYRLTIDYPIDQIRSIEIDPTRRMADIDRKNNSYPEITNYEYSESPTAR